jgi:hypothetical protein
MSISADTYVEIMNLKVKLNKAEVFASVLEFYNSYSQSIRYDMYIDEIYNPIKKNNYKKLLNVVFP